MPLHRFTDAEERLELEAVFKRAGIHVLNDIPVRSNRIRTQIDILGVYRNIVLLVQCAGSEILDETGDKISDSIIHLNTLANNLDEVISLMRTSADLRISGFIRECEAELAFDNRMILKIPMTMNLESGYDVEVHHKELLSADHV